MSTKQQIKEEMARDLSQSLKWQCLYEDEVTIDAIAMAEKLYDKGYRKASEVAEEIFAEIERMSIDTLRDIIEAESYDLDSLVEDQMHEFWTPYVERCGRECQFNFKARPKSAPVDNH